MYPHFLANIGNDTIYVPREKIEAQCSPCSTFGISLKVIHDHTEPAPHLNCMCGIYALKEKQQLLREMNHISHGIRFVYGEVNLWGTIIEHRDGYRAQYAYPKRLWCAPAIAPLAGWIGYVYGVPCEVMPYEDECTIVRENHWWPGPKLIPTKYACGHELIVQVPKTWTDYYSVGVRRTFIDWWARVLTRRNNRALCPKCSVTHRWYKR